MIPFKAEIILKFEASCIKEAREKIKYLTFLLKELYQTELKISESDRLFYEGVKNE